MYLGVEIDHKLRFETHSQNVVRKASQRMYIVRIFLYLSTKPIACMLFKNLMCQLSYCLPVLYPAMYQRYKKEIRKIFKDANSLGLEPGSILKLKSITIPNPALCKYICTMNNLCRNFSNAAHHAGLDILSTEPLGQILFFPSYVYLYK